MIAPNAGPREIALTASLTEALAPIHLNVLNESSGHTSRPGAESHFKVIVVSQAFVGKPLVQRHRAVHAAARAQLEGGLHALSIQAFTEEEWRSRGQQVQDSPTCPGRSS